MSRKELASHANGIWMCYRHGKMIDTDEVTYSVPMLQRWKQLSEFRARRSHELGRQIRLEPGDVVDFELVPERVEFSSFLDVKTRVAAAFRGACVETIWGKSIARTARDAAIEIVRNAFEYGHATEAAVAIEATFVQVTDNGLAFDSSALARRPGGGGAAYIRSLFERHGARVAFSSTHDGKDNCNRIALLRSWSDTACLAPCVVEIDDPRRPLSEVPQSSLRVCPTVYFTIEELPTLSDVLRLPRALVRQVPRDKRVVFVVSHAADEVVEMLRSIDQRVDVLVLET